MLTREQGRQARGRSAPLSFERLEDRLLLAVFTVTNLNDAGGGSLRQAILNANGAAGADEIVFQAGLSGTILLTSGEMLITGDLTITGNGQTNTIIDAQQGSRIFNVTGAGTDLTLVGMTLKNGLTASANASGGAIAFASTGASILSVHECTLSANSTAGASSKGGAIYSADAATAISITHSTVTGNSTTGGTASQGGAVFATGQVIIANSLFSGNFTSGSGARGGAVYSGGATSIVSSTFQGNSTTGGNADGGALYAFGGTTTIDQSTFSNNSTANVNAGGGAIQTALSAITITNSTLSGNQTHGNNSFGGAISSPYTTSITVINTTLSGNRVNQADSPRGGGAIFTDDGPVTVISSTITNNFANIGGGIGFLANAVGESLTVRNSIIAGNSANTNPDFTAPGNPAVNLIVQSSFIGRNDGTTLTATTGTTPDANGNFVGGGSPATARNPLLSPLQNNGGPTLTHQITNAASLAFNSGNNSFAAGLTHDQRGAPFQRILGGRVDMGAVEAPAPLILNNTAFFKGTSGNDVISYNATTRFAVVNGFAFAVPVAVTLVDLDALGGNDMLTLIGSAGNDRAVLSPQSLFYALDVGNNGSIDAVGRNAQTVSIHDGGGAADLAILNDTAGNDVFTATLLNATMAGNGYTNSVFGFESISGRSLAGGFDRALFFDAPGDQNFSATPTVATLGAPGFVSAANNFQNVIATANAGGANDRAFLFDGPGNDAFEVSSASMSANFAGDGFLNQVRLFEAISATSSAGGQDLAILRDSPGNDTFVSRPAISIMTSPGFISTASGFANVSGRSTAGGTDSAFLEDSPGNDIFNGTQGYSQMIGGGMIREAVGFSAVAARGLRGGFDIANLYDTPGNDTLSANPTLVNFSSAAGVFLQTLNFDRVNVICINGGANDRAFLSDSPGDDLFAGSGADGQLSGPNYALFVSLFDSVAITASTGINTRSTGNLSYVLTQVGNWIAI